MALLDDGGFLLSVPNYNDSDPGAFIMKVSADNKVTKFFTPPPHPQTKRTGPMGICLAPSGDVYYADNQNAPDTPETSRLMRIVVKDGVATEAVTVVSGMNVANAVAIKGDYVYVSETILLPESKPLISGIFRFKIGDEGIELKTLDSKRAFSEMDKIKLYRSQNGLCQLCLDEGKTEKQARVPWKKFQADHVIPWIKGGRPPLIMPKCSVLFIMRKKVITSNKGSNESGRDVVSG